MPLKRTLSLTLLTFYGLGSIIGAGIYALIGTVAKYANEYTPMSFLIAAIIAVFTGVSYAELSSRFPQSAGSALYVNKAFNNNFLSGVVGWLIVLTGIVSAGTLVHGFMIYLKFFLPLSSYIGIPIVIFTLGAIAIWGIQESAITIFLMTLVEITGLVIIIWYGKDKAFVEFSKLDHEFFPKDFQTWMGIMTGAYVAFYAFIGFEDMVNVAEETKNPTKTIPLAILLALTGATILYLVVSSVVILSLPYQDLTTASSPLITIIKYQGHSPLLFSLIAMLAISNGILVQIIMASRLIYGMSNLKSAPKIFSTVFERTQVPLIGIVFVCIIIVILAYWFPIQTLAKATSTIILFIFLMMHASLIRVKYKYGNTKDHISFPIIFPMIGIGLSISFLISQLL